MYYINILFKLKNKLYSLFVIVFFNFKNLLIKSNITPFYSKSDSILY